MIDIDQLHGEIWYQVAYTMALLEGDKQKSKEVYKELSDKIHEILVSRVELPVILQGELLPCPFCGSEDIRKEERSKGYWIITCNDCWASLRNLHTEEIAISTWNKRAGREPQTK